MNKISLILNIYIFCLLSCLCFSQSRISGTVTDKNTKVGLAGNISLQSLEGKDISYCFSDTNGYFSLKANFIGKFKLRVSVLNYETKFLEVALDVKNLDELTKNIELTYKSLELNEVIIRTEKAVTIRKDTIVFDAKKFLKGNEQVVEDLIKLLPGVSVSNDGTIRVAGQEVEKIMIDGDDFFQRGYKLISKNMPVQPIDKVELYQKYSNNKHLKGIEDSNKVALNLKLKEHFKRRWFGTLQAGSGVVSENRYDMRSNLLNIGKVSKYYILSNINNVGFDATGDLNSIIRPTLEEESAQIGDNQNAQNIININNMHANLEPKRSNINDDLMISANSIFTLSPITKLKLQILSNKNSQNFNSTNIQNFSVNDLFFTNVQKNLNFRKRLTDYGSIEIAHDIDKNKTISTTTKFNLTTDKTISNSIFNDTNIEESLQSNNKMFDQKISYTHKLATTKVMIFSGRYIHERTPQTYLSNQYLYQSIFSTNADNILQNSTNQMEFGAIEMQFMNKQYNKLFQIFVGNQYRNDALETKFLLKNNQDIASAPINYQNDAKYIVNDTYLKTSYQFRFGQLSLSPQIELHQFQNTLNQLLTEINQSPFFVNPKIKTEFLVNDKSKLITNLSYNKTNATILNVYTNSINNELRSFIQGTGTFDQLSSTNANFAYNYGNWGDKSFFSTSINFVRNHDFFSTNKFINQQSEQTQQLLLKNRTVLSANINYDHYIKILKSNLKIQIFGSQSNFANMVNNSELREVQNRNIENNIELRSGFSSLFNYHVGTRFTFFSTEVIGLKNNFVDNRTFADLTFIFSKELNLQVQTERYYFGNLNKEANTYYFADFLLQYKPLKSKLNFALVGNNLFNTNIFRNFSVSDIGTSTSEFELIPRYLLLKMDYRF